MSTSPREIVVTAGRCSSCPTVHRVLVRHRDFPEVQGEGDDAGQAARHLLRNLITEGDRVANGWHRRSLQQVIADVRAFIDQSPEPLERGPSHSPSHN